MMAFTEQEKPNTQDELLRIVITDTAIILAHCKTTINLLKFSQILTSTMIIKVLMTIIKGIDGNYGGWGSNYIN
jgi:hypothetical protein